MVVLKDLPPASFCWRCPCAWMWVSTATPGPTLRSCWWRGEVGSCCRYCCAAAVRTGAVNETAVLHLPRYGKVLGGGVKPPALVILRHHRLCFSAGLSDQHVPFLTSIVCHHSSQLGLTGSAKLGTVPTPLNVFFVLYMNILNIYSFWIYEYHNQYLNMSWSIKK